MPVLKRWAQTWKQKLELFESIEIFWKQRIPEFLLSKHLGGTGTKYWLSLGWNILQGQLFLRRSKVHTKQTKTKNKTLVIAVINTMVVQKVHYSSASAKKYYSFCFHKKVPVLKRWPQIWKQTLELFASNGIIWQQEILSDWSFYFQKKSRTGTTLLIFFEHWCLKDGHKIEREREVLVCSKFHWRRTEHTTKNKTNKQTNKHSCQSLSQ